MVLFLLILLLNYNFIDDYFHNLIRTNFINTVSLYSKNCSLHPNLVFAVLGDVPDPWQGLIATLFDDLEVTNLHARNSEVRYLKLDLDGNATVLLSLFCFNRGEPELGPHQEFLASSELLDTPNHRVRIWHILHCANVGFEDGRVNIRWNWHNDLDVVRN